MGKGKIRVRRAKPQDRKLFLKLYKEHLESVQYEPGRALPTERNLEVIGRVFDSYVSGELDGVVLLVAQDAMLMHGEQGEPLLETNLGRTATGWGIYVRENLRGRGVIQKMYKRSKTLLREMGFDHVYGCVSVDTGPGRRATEKAGFKGSSLLIHLPLAEKEDEKPESQEPEEEPFHLGLTEDTPDGSSKVVEEEEPFHLGLSEKEE